MNASCHNCIGYLGIWLRLTEMKNQLCAWEWKQFFRWYSLFISPLATGKAASGASTRCEVVDWGQHVQQDVFWGTLSVSVLFAVTFEGLLGAREFLENGMESTGHFATHEDGWWRRWNPQHLYQPHFSHLTISTAKLLWNIAEKSWNLEGFVQLQLPDAQNAGGVLQATRLLVCQSQGSPKLESSFFGWVIRGDDLVLLCIACITQNLGSAYLVPWSSDLQASKNWCGQCDSFKVPPGEGTRCSLRMRYEGPDGQKGEPSTEAIIEGVFTSKTAFWKYRNRHDMYIIYAWIFIYISVYTAMLYAFNL